METPEIVARNEVVARSRPEFWFERAGIPKRFWSMSLRDYDPERGDHAILDAAKHFDDALQQGTHAGKGLTLLGPPGRGKTMISAILACNHIRRTPPTGGAVGLFEYTPPATFTTLARYQRALHQEIKLDRPDLPEDDRARWFRMQEDRERLITVPLLVIDDVGKERVSKVAHIESEFDLLVRERFDVGLPTILSANFKLAGFTTRYSLSMTSFLHEATAIVGAPGTDQRLP